MTTTVMMTKKVKTRSMNKFPDSRVIIVMMIMMILMTIMTMMTMMMTMTMPRSVSKFGARLPREKEGQDHTKQEGCLKSDPLWSILNPKVMKTIFAYLY